MKAFDQRLRFRIGFGIEPLMRMAVTAEKALQPKDIAVFGAADDHRSAGTLLQQTDTTEDEGAHDAFPEFRLRDQQCPKLVRWDDQRLDRSLCMGIDQSRSPRQLRQFAHECARAVSDDWLAATRFEVLGDIDLASQDDGETKAHFTDSSQRLSYAIGADLAEPTDPLDVRRFQSGEHLVASRIHDRLLRYRHD